jgi:AraC-like DNA-binding protein
MYGITGVIAKGFAKLNEAIDHMILAIKPLVYILTNFDTYIATFRMKNTRPQQTLSQFIQLIDEHLADLTHHRTTDMHEIEDFAELMHIHPTHLSNTIKEVSGTSPCGIYQTKIIETAKQLLADPYLSIRDIAFILTFDPSQFTKWFKRLAGTTPKQYRAGLTIKA